MTEMDRRRFLRDAALTVGAGMPLAFSGRSSAWAESLTRPPVEAREALPRSGDLGGVRAATVQWMSRIPDDTDIRGMSIPGTHESCARYAGGSAGFAQCQNRPLDWQLRAGVRYIDIRCQNWHDYFTIHHGRYYQEMVFGQVLQICADFLKKYPTETVLMRVQQEHSTDSDRYKRIFKDYLDKKGWRSYFHISSGFPTLKTARGKIVLMTGWPWVEEGLRFSDDSQFSVQDLYKDPTLAKKKNAIDAHLRAAIWQFNGNKMYVNHLSANGVGGSTWTPWSYVKDLNPWTRKLLEGQYYYKTHRTGVIAMDYVDSPDANWDAGDIDMTASVIRLNTFKRPTLQVGKSYVIWNRGTGKALDGGTAQTSVVQWTYSGYPQQRWTLERADNGTYRLRCERSGKCLTCHPGSGATQENGYHCTWHITPHSDGDGFQLKLDTTGTYLHTPGNNKGSGVQPSLGSNGTQDECRWVFDERVQVQ
ncbi:phosphatidylinositol-specific phospholipase C domain-containing protein [Streptomyces albofaciens JCM 4342]|uniref:phosphatidylinositol-specific phospholipase C domain-containing protein n=1 Tax=Streptomyces albofaciens TaxID=66866 RepID=UPI00123B5BA4|nr:phosphatidylinositol-specific phospholipase C domain-containing protein [Streptomyces albofaciens]KAA6212431.1 phosphatidylinositol-specific phospholipase C domain-containing protein [Streptomyces albofaciens JCM 4342]